MHKQDYSQPNDKTTEMNTLVSCMNRAVKDGYVDNYKVAHGELFSETNMKYYKPSEVEVNNFYRFEGESDPSENTILYLIETKDGAKGLLLDAYGAYADENISKFIKEVENIHKKTITGSSKKSSEEGTGTKNKERFLAHLVEPPIRNSYTGTEKLKDQVAIITGGDSGIGRAVAVHFAREGADIAIVYLKSEQDAEQTKELVEKEGRKCILFKGDVSNENFCKDVCEQTSTQFGKINILVNNAGTHEPQDKVQKITKKQLLRTFEVNIFPFFYMTEYALKYISDGGVVINTTSVTAFRGSSTLIDYSASKGAITSFTRSLAKNLAEKNIRVNAVAPGPVWTPLVIASFDAEHLGKFGQDTPLGRAGYPYEIAPAYVYLASKDSSYMTGQILHINGGEIVD